MRFSIYQESKKGGRRNNQDRMGYCYTRDALLLVVADGMGGHVQGEMAAQIAVQTLGANFQKQATPTLKSPQRFLEDSLLDAHREIHHYCETNKLPESPRTTVIACVVQKGAAYWAHAGDSRLYWMRAGEVIAQTRDHSKIQSMIQQGLVSPDEIDKHPERNKLFNCLGSPSAPTVELSRKMTLKPGDTLFLCTDGLWSVVSETMIASAFAGNTVMRAVPDLIYLALLEGGTESDNVTGMAMTWEGTDLGDDNTGISTLLMPLGAITTTIHASRPSEFEVSAGQEGLSEDEIEKAIEEIRATIRKSNKLMPKV
ncbi:MAG: PP2C family serine/threonine-protein phosphatase [Burkholderiaceae bacterium]|jgi:protein phosphatase